MNKKGIIIILSVTILLVIGIVILKNIDTSKTDDNSNTSASAEPSYMVYKTDVNDLKSIHVTSDGIDIEIQNNGDGTWKVNGLDDIDSNKAYTLVSMITNIYSKNKVEENPSDLSKYGLDNPSINVVLTKNSGEADTLYVGDHSPTLGEYFLMKEGDNTVYTLYTHKVDTLIEPLSYYRDFNRFSINIDDITEISIERSNHPIKLKIADNIADTTNNVWEMIEPYKTTANDEYIDKNILEVIDSINLSAVAEDGDHGTDNPSAVLVLTVKPFDENTSKYGDEYTETIVIGDTKDGKTYVKYNNQIFETSSETFEFVSSDAYSIISKLQALVPINKVKSVTFSYDNKEDVMEIIQSDSDMNFKVNGDDADTKLSKSMYQAAIALSVDGVYNGNTLGENVLTIKFSGINKSDDTTVEFNAINDLNCAVTRNGKTDFIIKRTKIDEFIEVLKTFIDNPNG